LSKVAQSLLVEFGEAVLRARSLEGWQLKDLSREMGGTSGISFLSDIEKGKRSISPPTVGKLIKALNLDEGWIDRFLGSGVTEETEVTPSDRLVDATLEQSEKTGSADRLRAAGVTESAMIALAQRIAAETNDLDKAWLELRNAIDRAVKLQADGLVNSTKGGGVDEVNKRVAELSAVGEYRSAGDEIDAALSREQEEHLARSSKFLDRGVEVALLDRDTSRAAELLVQKSDLESGKASDQQDLRALQDLYFTRGRDQGLNLDLELSISLARIILDRATETDERGLALTDLGMALGALGRRENKTERLEEAVVAFSTALDLQTREQAPLDWANVYDCLGTVLSYLGEREAGNTRLEEALAAFNSALEVRKKDTTPDDWARTQNNLGIALQMLAQRERGSKRLDQAISAFRAVTEHWHSVGNQALWATSMTNLGNALSIKAERLIRNGSGHQELDEAIEAYRAALAAINQATQPLDWATIQNNLGNALWARGDLGKDADMLRSATDRFNAALEVQPEETVPLARAATYYNLGGVLRLLGSMTGEVDVVQKGIQSLQESLRLRTREMAAVPWGMTKGSLASSYLACFEIDKDREHLQKALRHIVEALEVFQEANTPHYVTLAEKTYGVILNALQSEGLPE